MKNADKVMKQIAPESVVLRTTSLSSTSYITVQYSEKYF